MFLARSSGGRTSRSAEFERSSVCTDTSSFRTSTLVFDDLGPGSRIMRARIPLRGGVS
jgi:hypothetical protein